MESIQKSNNYGADPSQLPSQMMQSFKDQIGLIVEHGVTKTIGWKQVYNMAGMFNEMLTELTGMNNSGPYQGQLAGSIQALQAITSGGFFHDQSQGTGTSTNNSIFKTDNCYDGNDGINGAKAGNVGKLQDLFVNLNNQLNIDTGVAGYTPGDYQSIITTCFDNIKNLFNSDIDYPQQTLLAIQEQVTGLGNLVVTDGSVPSDVSSLLRNLSTYVNNVTYNCNVGYPEGNSFNSMKNSTVNETTSNDMKFQILDNVFQQVSDKLSLAASGNSIPQSEQQITYTTQATYSQAVQNVNTLIGELQTDLGKGEVNNTLINQLYDALGTLSDALINSPLFCSLQFSPHAWVTPQNYPSVMRTVRNSIICPLNLIDHMMRNLDVIPDDPSNTLNMLTSCFGTYPNDPSAGIYSGQWAGSPPPLQTMKDATTLEPPITWGPTMLNLDESGVLEKNPTKKPT